VKPRTLLHIFYHLLFWTVLACGWYFFRFEDFRNKQLLWDITLLKVVDLAFMVYITNYLLIPKLLYKKRYWEFGVLFLTVVIVSSFLKMHFEGMLMNNPRAFDLSYNLKGRIYDNTIPHLLLVSTGAAFKLLLDYARAQQRMAGMAKANAEAELSFLKSQINPHFLFNSLNAVYFLIDKENNEARDSLHTFSEMLRYQLYDCNGDTTPIEKELAYLKDYIDLQKLRRNNNTEINFVCSGDLQGFSIAPLLLIPFVENAFKHLSHHNNKPDTIDIALERKAGQLLFTVSNSTEMGSRRSELPAQGGIGLKNVQRRLELLYPDKHSLAIVPGIDNFMIELKLAI
jgi:two-component system LytT family sensor kinase